MRCPKCGSIINDESVSCKFCKQKLSAEGKLKDKQVKEKSESIIDSYNVIYLGGHPEYLKGNKWGSIKFNIFEDYFELLPTIGSKNWFNGLKIQFTKVHDFQIVQRQVGTFEGIFGGLDSRQLNQPNNIHITYEDKNGNKILLRLEMITGFTVMGQAKKCLELEDRLKVNNIKSKFKKVSDELSQQNIIDIPTQIEKLSQLRDKGIISTNEFESKKTDLLSRM